MLPEALEALKALNEASHTVKQFDAKFGAAVRAMLVGSHAEEKGGKVVINETGKNHLKMFS